MKNRISYTAEEKAEVFAKEKGAYWTITSYEHVLLLQIREDEKKKQSIRIKAILWGFAVEWWYSRLFGNSRIGKSILKELRVY